MIGEVYKVMAKLGTSLDKRLSLVEKELGIRTFTRGPNGEKIYEDEKKHCTCKTCTCGGK